MRDILGRVSFGSEGQNIKYSYLTLSFHKFSLAFNGLYIFANQYQTVKQKIIEKEMGF